MFALTIKNSVVWKAKIAYSIETPANIPISYFMAYANNSLLNCRYKQWAYASKSQI